MSFENLFMINGVVVNENIRGQPLDLYIEDAIQETTTSTSGVSAEYGRFQGGVVNMLTKSGGNRFSGSFRANLSSDSWQSSNAGELTPERDDTVNTIYEATFGGFILRDKLWFFTAGRDLSTSATQTTYLTNIEFPQTSEQTRLEGKLTWSITPNHRLIGSYAEIEFKPDEHRFRIRPRLRESQPRTFGPAGHHVLQLHGCAQRQLLPRGPVLRAQLHHRYRLGRNRHVAARRHPAARPRER